MYRYQCFRSPTPTQNKTETINHKELSLLSSKKTHHQTQQSKRSLFSKQKSAPSVPSTPSEEYLGPRRQRRGLGHVLRRDRRRVGADAAAAAAEAALAEAHLAGGRLGMEKE